MSRGGRVGAFVVGASICVLLVGHFLAVLALSRVGPPDGTERQSAYYADIDRDVEIVHSDGRPYRDFDVEYPPLVLAQLEAVGGSSAPETLHRLAWSQFALELLTIGALAWAWGRKVVLGYLVLTIPFVAFPFVFVRTDMLASALAVVGVAALKKGAATTGAVALALSLFAKVWPITVAPVVLVRRQNRAVGAWIVATTVGALAWVAWGGLGGPFQVLTFRGADAWHVESMIGSVWHALSGATPQLVSGALRVGYTPPGASGALGLVALLLIVLVWLRADRRRDDERMVFGVAPLVAVCALLVCSPLLSPQYMLWLLPWAAIAAIPTDVSKENAFALGALTFVATAMTSVMYAHYTDVISGRTVGYLTLLSRNVALLGILVVGFRTLATPAVPRDGSTGGELLGAPRTGLP